MEQPQATTRDDRVFAGTVNRLAYDWILSQEQRLPSQQECVEGFRWILRNPFTPARAEQPEA